MADDVGRPMSDRELETYILVTGPRDRCGNCGSGKPAGFRNFCPHCGKYPAEVMGEREHHV